MKTFLETDTRRIIPRWRDSRTTIASGELRPISPVRNVADKALATSLREKEAEWIQERTAVAARELVSAALIAGSSPEAENAAGFLLERADPTLPHIREAARRIFFQEDGGKEGQELELGDAREAIGRLRLHLHLHPRNPLGWVDLGRLYAREGLPKQAKKSVLAGLSLAPSHRFTLRSMARLLVHLHEEEEADSLLRSHPATLKDPWLASAAIAVATVLGRVPSQVKVGRAMLESRNFSSYDLSELACALGSLEIEAGNVRGAKKLFRQALVEPSDNSIAQVEWAGHKLDTSLIEASHLKHPFSFEARAAQFYWSGEWEASLEECRQWQEDEGFSGRPAALGTFVAAVLLEDYEICERMARRGLIANPNDAALLNNLAFSLASTNRAQEAERILKTISVRAESVEYHICATATAGLIAFRLGKCEEGRDSYRAAIELARGPRNKFYAAMAAAYWAREEIRAAGPQVHIDEALNLSSMEQKQLDPQHKRILDVLLARTSQMVLT